MKQEEREEELRQYLKERNIPMDSLEANSIIEGINWADKHPKEGFISIDKAYEWLEAELYQHKDRDGYPNVESRSYTSVRDLIDDFKKAMEE